jgi:hypothetical protein
MTEGAPDWIVRTYRGPGHAGLPAPGSGPGLTPAQTAQFQQWNQEVATKPGLAAGDIPVAGTTGTGVAAGQLAVTPATSVAVTPTNLMVSQNFTNADTVIPDRNWSHDAEDGNLTLGCLRVDCDGLQNDYLSNEIPVVTGETIEVACQTKRENITYTGTEPIVLGVQKFRKGKDQATGGVKYLDIGSVDVAWLTSPSDTEDWGTEGDLAGTYVVEAGVDMVRARVAAPGVTEGTVKYDEIVFLKLDLIDDAAVPGVGTTVDDIVRELYGADGDSFSHNEAAVALANTQAALLGMNGRLSALEAEASVGAVAADDMLFTGEITADANWGGSYALATSAGHYEADGHDAVWVPTGITPFSANQIALYDWQGTDLISGTDYQLVQLLLSSAPATGPNNFKSYVFLLARVSSGLGTFLRATFGSDGTWGIDYWNGSSFVLITNGTCPVPGSSALLSFYAGDKDTTTPRRYKLKVNSTTIADFPEVGTGSSLGASNRRWGWGAKAEGGFYMDGWFGATGQGTPPKINQWLAYEQ